MGRTIDLPNGGRFGLHPVRYHTFWLVEFNWIGFLILFGLIPVALLSVRPRRNPRCLVVPRARTHTAVEASWNPNRARWMASVLLAQWAMSSLRSSVRGRSRNPMRQGSSG
jgi:hypothetical protein